MLRSTNACLSNPLEALLALVLPLADYVHYHPASAESGKPERMYVYHLFLWGLPPCRMKALRLTI